MPKGSARCSSRAASSSPARRAIPASSGSSRCTTSCRRATRVRSARPTSKATPVLGVDCVRTIDELPDGPWDLVFVCTPGRRERRPVARVRTRGRAGRVPDERGLRRSRRRKACAPSAISSRSPTSWASCSRARTARASCRRRRACARRSSRPYPPAGRIAIASQSGNFVSSFENWSVQTGVGVSRAVSAGNAAALVGRRLPRLVRRRRRDRGQPRVRRRRGRRPRALRAPRRGRAAQAGRAREGRHDREWSAGRREPHRQPGGRRSHLRRHVPTSRNHACGDRRRSVRGRGHASRPSRFHAGRAPRC